MRRVRLAAFAVAVLAAAAACSSDAAPADQTGTSSSVAPSAPSGHGAYALCLEDNGVSAGVPAPPSGPGKPPGVDQATWDKAVQVCSSLAPGPGPPQPDMERPPSR